MSKAAYLEAIGVQQWVRQGQSPQEMAALNELASSLLFALGQEASLQAADIYYQDRVVCTLSDLKACLKMPMRKKQLWKKISTLQAW